MRMKTASRFGIVTRDEPIISGVRNELPGVNIGGFMLEERDQGLVILIRPTPNSEMKCQATATLRTGNRPLDGYI